MSVVIYTDSTCEFKNEWYEQNNVHMLPLTYLIGEEEFIDSVEEEDILRFYHQVEDGALPKTSAVNTQAFIQSWTPHLEAGDDIFFTGIGKKFSATVGNAQNAAQKLKEKYPERTIIALDSGTATSGLSDIIVQCCQLRDQGCTVQEIGEQAAVFAPKSEGWICVDDLQHLKRGGRLSGAAATIGSILNIKPLLHLQAGKLDLSEKIKGTKKTVKFLIQKLKESAANPYEDPIYIIYGLTDDLANEIEAAVKAEFGNENIIKKRLGCVIGCHTGPYVAGLFFRSK